jgi:hypothetical protein
VHGELENILDERKKALRTTLSRSLRKCTSLEELGADLAGKGIRMDFYKEHQDTYNGKPCNGVGFDDGQGRIWGYELGADFTAGRLMEQVSDLEASRERAEREKLYQKRVDGLLASYFLLCKGDSTKVARMLASTTPEQRETTIREFREIHGQEGATYARQQLAKFDRLTDYQLRTERDALKKLGHDVGLSKGLTNGLSPG